MTSLRQDARSPASRWMGLALAAGMLAAPGGASASPLDLYYERTVMTATDGRCGLFEPAVSTALNSAQVQARGASLRMGTDKATLNAVADRARNKAAGVPCDSPDVALAAGRVKTAFEGFARMTRLTYPGDHAAWKADREDGRTIRWRLAQTTAFGWDRMVFGLAGKGRPGVLLALVHFADGAKPYGARIVLRDADRTLGPYLDGHGGQVDMSLPLAKRMPINGALVTFSAEARSAAGLDLLPRDLKSGWAFRFPVEAQRRLAELDPRESIAVEFLFAGDRDTVRRAYVEVGDFAAGRAFLHMAQR